MAYGFSVRQNYNQNTKGKLGLYVTKIHLTQKLASLVYKVHLSIKSGLY